MSTHSGADEGAELLELLLEHGLSESLRRLAAQGQLERADELRALAAFLSGCRAGLTATPTPHFVAQVLARTTRQDLRWRGDLLLVARFCGDALAASPLLRVAAALLILPLLGAPLLAWLMLRAPELPHGIRARLEAARVEPFLPAVPEGPADEVQFVAPESALGGPIDSQSPLIVSAPSPARATAARAASAEVQSAQRLPFVVGQGPLGRALDQRRSGWNGNSTGAAALPAGAGGLLRALRVEVLLDRWAAEERAPIGLEPALAALGRDAREPLDVLRLEALALDRARSFGSIDASAWARLAHAGARPGDRDLSPIDWRWRASLEAALRLSDEGRALLAEPALASWLAQR